MQPIPNHPNYYADEDGNIWRKKKNGQFRKFSPSQKTADKPYLGIQLKDASGKVRSRYVHHLILETFVGERPSIIHVARHLNDKGDDNRLHNLRWGTPEDNKNDRLANIATHKARKAKIISEMFTKGFSFDEIKDATGWDENKVRRVCRLK